MSVRKSVLWAFSGQIISFAMTLTTSIVIARLLSPHEMGIYAVAFATLGILQIFAAFDMATYVVREKDVDTDTLDAVFTVNALLCAGLAGATYIFSFAAAGFLGEPAVARALEFLAIGPLLLMFEFRPYAMLQRAAAFHWISAVTIGRTVVGALVSIVAALHGHSYMSLAYGNLAYALFGVAAYNLILPEHARIRFRGGEWRRLSVFGLRMMTISGIANLAVRLSDIIIARMLGLAALGLYSRAGSITSMIFQNIYGTATRIAFVQLARDYRERGILRDTFLRGLEMITAVMWPILIGLAVLARPVILLMFGAQWLPAALPLALLLISQFLILCFGMNWELFVLRDETRRQSRFEVARAGVSLALCIAAATISITAVAASRIAEALVGMLLYLPHMNRMAGTTTADLVRIYGQSLLLTIVAVLPAAILMQLHGWAASTPLPLIGASVVLGIVLWVCTLAIMRHALFSEIRRVAVRFGVGSL